MFPKLSGGVAIFGHEAWKRYTTLVGPIAAVGYWIGWSVVLSISGAIVGYLLQAQFYADATWGTTTSSLLFGLDFNSNPAIWVGAVVIVAIWVANVFGVRPAVWTGYVTGRRALLPALPDDDRAVHHRRLQHVEPAQQHRSRCRLGQRQRRSASSSRGCT